MSKLLGEFVALGVAGVALIVLVSGCSLTEPRACTAQFVYGISVQVIDAATSAQVTEGLTGDLMDAGYTEVMEVFGNTLVGAGERPGHYSIVVSASGYQDWSRTDVEVRGGECHVNPVAFEARLSPSPSA